MIMFCLGIYTTCAVINVVQQRKKKDSSYDGIDMFIDIIAAPFILGTKYLLKSK
jgi:hypothetical protein